MQKHPTTVPPPTTPQKARLSRVPSLQGRLLGLAAPAIASQHAGTSGGGPLGTNRSRAGSVVRSRDSIGSWKLHPIGVREAFSEALDRAKSSTPLVNYPTEASEGADANPQAMGGCRYSISLPPKRPGDATLSLGVGALNT